MDDNCKLWNSSIIQRCGSASCGERELGDPCCKKHLKDIRMYKCPSCPKGDPDCVKTVAAVHFPVEQAPVVQTQQTADEIIRRMMGSKKTPATADGSSG